MNFQLVPAGKSVRALAADHMAGAKMDRMALFGGGSTGIKKCKVLFDDTQSPNGR